MDGPVPLVTLSVKPVASVGSGTTSTVDVKTPVQPDERLRVESTGVQLVQSWPLGAQVLLVSIIGRSRSGKSTLGNELPSALAAFWKTDIVFCDTLITELTRGFGVQSGSDAVSRGITVLPVLIPLPKYNNRFVAFADVEGSQNGSSTVTTTLTAIAVALSSVVLLRVVEPMVPTRDIDNVSLASELASLAESELQASPSQTDCIPVKAHLCCLFRDVPVQTENPDLKKVAIPGLSSASDNVYQSLAARYNLHAASTAPPKKRELVAHNLSKLVKSSTEASGDMPALRRSIRDEFIPQLATWLLHAPVFESFALRLKHVTSTLVQTTGIPRSVAELEDHNKALQLANDVARRHAPAVGTVSVGTGRTLDAFTNALTLLCAGAMDELTTLLKVRNILAHDVASARLLSRWQTETAPAVLHAQVEVKAQVAAFDARQRSAALQAQQQLKLEQERKSRARHAAIESLHTECDQLTQSMERMLTLTWVNGTDAQFAVLERQHAQCLARLKTL